VIGTVPAGYVFEIITARSAGGDWLRVEFNGGEGWVNVAPLTILSGDVGALPVADPRTIPYGGFESPRAGRSEATSDNRVRITNGLRVRAGPSQGYPTIANMFANTVVPVFGRTASNAWLQVNYEGNLGWISTQFVEFLDGLQITSLPIDGIVAEGGPPLAEATDVNFADTLRLMLARLDLAQPSLDNIRGKWTDAALTGRAGCRDYPARPSDFSIAVPLLARYYVELNPVLVDFNDAMFNLRRAIDLFIEVCNQPGFQNPVGQATVIGALDIVNLVDSQFASLRQRLLALIPPVREPGPDECLFTFGRESEILPLVSIGQIVRTTFTPINRIAGFCIDAEANQQLALQTLVIRGNLRPLIIFTPINNPTNFLANTPQSPGSDRQLVGPIVIPETGRYLIIFSDLNPGPDPVNGELAFAVTTIPTTGLIPAIIYDAASDNLYFAITPTAGTTGQGTGTTQSNFPGTGGVTCPSVTFTCEQLFTCQEAYACLAQGAVGLDADGDGIPCEALCIPGGSN
jgi:uncharacterized protein YraI